MSDLLVSPAFLTQLDALQLKSRKVFWGKKFGEHVSKRRGHGIEFSDYRNYEIGDDPRRIDWKLFGRSERLYVKRFQEEADLNIYIILDTSASMFAVDAEKWKLARQIVLGLLHVAINQKDSATVIIPKFGIFKISGHKNFQNLNQQLTNLSLPANPATSRDLQLTISAMKFPGLAFLVSDLLDEPPNIKDFCQLALARNLDLNVIRTLGQEDLNPNWQNSNRLIDAESGERLDLDGGKSLADDYQVAFAQHARELSDFFYSRQIGFWSAPTNHSLEHFFVKEFSRFQW